MKPTCNAVTSFRSSWKHCVPRRGLLLVSICTLLFACLLPRTGSAQGCVDQGLDLGPGLSFLEGNAQPDSSHPMVSVTADPLATRLILASSDTTRTTIQIANVNCSKTASGTGWQGDNRMWVYCSEGTNCVQDEVRADDTQPWQPSGDARGSATYVTAAGDAASTAQLSSTFSHVIYLLQQIATNLNTDTSAPSQ